jgi:hypothetical protein
MADEQKEPWLNHMALATVILAVCATLSTFKGSSYSTQSVINQTQASDQWAFYQAKSTKQHLHELQAELLRLQVMTLPAKSSAASAYARKIEEYAGQVARYEREKKDIEAKARELETQRDDAKRHNRPFGLAVMFLQVAILLNSIAGLMKVKKIWWASLPVGLTGLGFFLDGFFTIF